MASPTTSEAIPVAAGASEWTIPPECTPDVTHLVIEDGKPVDNTLHERNMHLLVELHTCWAGPGENRPFIVFANVGLFYAYREPPVVPDVMLSLDVKWPNDLSKKENLSYFMWIVGKHPDVAIEIVSRQEGGEDSYKLKLYEKIGIPYYVIFDPKNKLGAGVLRSFELVAGHYRALPSNYFEGVGLGVKLWEGEYSAIHDTWLRWCDKDGQLIPTAEEKAVKAEKLAGEIQQENERLRQLLRSHGIEPPL